MNDQHTTDVLIAQIDRLAAGELPETDRRSLLAWLDEEPTRWRTCALAFLEAQAWEQAAEGSGFRVQGSASGGQKSDVGGQTTHHSPLTTHLSLRTWLAAAALVLVAFLAGLASARYLPGDAPTAPQFAGPIDAPAATTAQPLVATVSLPTNLDPRLMAQLKLPVTSTSVGALPQSSIPAYVRQQWERRGFELTEEIRYLPATLPDGREVMVPITKVHVKFKGTPVS